LNVLGEGRETKRWKSLAEKLSLPNVTWLGHLPLRREALQAMGQSDVFVHSSFREGTPMVVLEAMAWGLPVICHDVCGMAVAVDARSGVKVPFENPERSIQGFREAIEGLLRDPGLVERLSEGALGRALELSWDVKVKEIAEAYVRCVQQDDGV
jgi:glycosyltransferase involved in cell wall biosynthesis